MDMSVQLFLFLALFGTVRLSSSFNCPQLQPPKNGVVKFRPNGLIVTCNDGYEFSKNKIGLFAQCSQQEWYTDDEIINSLPPCKAKCVPECQNGGTCVSPNQCQCQRGFGGLHCQTPISKRCQSLPQIKGQYGDPKCTSDFSSCTVTCQEKFAFPDGSPTIYLSCRNGAWVLTNSDKSSIPDCAPSCFPPCQNGGKCWGDKCQCPVDFKGPQCQYTKHRCNPREMGFNGNDPVCHENEEMMICQISCQENYKFDSPPEDQYTCRWTVGSFEPSPVPRCVKETRFEYQSKDGRSKYIRVTKESSWSSPQVSSGYSTVKSFNRQFSYTPTVSWSQTGPYVNNMLNNNHGNGVNSNYLYQFKNLSNGQYFNSSGFGTGNGFIPDFQKFMSLGSTLADHMGYSSSKNLGGSYGGGWKVQNSYQSTYPTYTIHKESFSGSKSGNSYGANSRFSRYSSSSNSAFGSQGGYTSGNPFNGQYGGNLKSGSGYGNSYSFNGYGSSSNSAFGDQSGYNSKYLSNGQYGSSSNSKIVDSNTQLFRSIYPQAKTCFTWGGSHFKTFDGEMYSFNGNCAYILMQDTLLETVTIAMQNSPGCQHNEGICHKIIKIYLTDKEYVLSLNEKGTPILKSLNKTLPIPAKLPGIQVEMSSHFVLVFLNSPEVNLKWDGRNFVQIKSPESLWDKTAGLCGRMNGDINDDKTTRDNKRPRNTATFASSWKLLGLGEICDDNIVDLYTCDNGKSLTQNATDFCSKLLSDDKFTICSQVINPKTLQEYCQWDYCNCPLADKRQCSCDTMNVYIRQCHHDHIISSLDWRSDDTCPMQCQGGKIYKACGPKSQATCTADFLVSSSEDGNCEEGCFCPKNTVLHEDKCISREKCPCTLRGKLFQPGESVFKDCNTCTCMSGKWVCTEVTCSARCSVIGDPHYTTFDGKNYDFMGKCNYYLVKGDNYSIETQNVQCNGAISESLGFSKTTFEAPSCTKSVTIRIGKVVIKLKQNLQVLVNGEDISVFPTQAKGANIRFASNLFVIVDIENGLQVWWDGVTSVFIKAPPEFRGKTRGLCGTFNANQKDDFLTPAGDIEQSDAAFANKWKTNEVCTNVEMKEPQHPCSTNPERVHDSEKYCSKLRGDVFSNCNWYVDPAPFYDDCKYDMCACAGDIKQCLSPTFAAYARECAIAGVIILWREKIEGFQLHCPQGQEYQVCGSSCSRSCKDISFNSNCKEECVEGCNCPKGKTLNAQGECVPIGECSCTLNGLQYNAGYREIRSESSGKKLCTCAGGTWTCNPATAEEIQKYPAAGSLQTVCDASKHLVMTKCEPIEPKTCRNMHTAINQSPAICHPGCVCKQGYVLDTISNTCVKKKECPCYHSGASYLEGFSIQQDCNTCQCSYGKWNCSNRICSRVCSVWGDSHYTTFDEKSYDFQGSCDYVLAKGSLSEDETFDISIQNVPCGNSEVSCSKSVTLTIGSGNNQESITLAHGKDLPFKIFKRIVIRRSGLFVFLDVPDLGLVLQWDQGTRVYVKLNPKWKTRTRGLCGDYNDNAEDDFKTPSGGIPEVSARLFGDSWKKDDYCPESARIIDTCTKYPGRKVWAVQECGFLESEKFEICHKELDPAPFIQRCIFDTCACVQGDDCHCLCTALSSYAHECNRRGFPVKWRCSGRCDIQCPDKFIYSPCMSTCPYETCDNLATFNDRKHSCTEDTCVEGCAPEKCPEGYIFRNDSFLECIPRRMCKPICQEIDGILYYEGDKVSDDECQTCFCSHGKISCSGAACSKPKPAPLTVPPVESFNASDKITVITNRTVTTHITVHSGSCSVENEYLPHTSNCEIFYHCGSGAGGLIWYEKTCGPNMFYNPTIKNCDWPASVIAIRPECGSGAAAALKIDNRCKEDEHWSECAVECNRVCQYYRHLLVLQNYCTVNDNCVPGCVKDSNVCAANKYWRDFDTCVDLSDCPCKSRSGKRVKPGAINKESECEVCQCLSNYYTCDRSACSSSVSIDETTYIEKYEILTLDQQKIIVTSTVSPAKPCYGKKYVSLFEQNVDGEILFNASSSLNSKHEPKYAMLTASDEKKGDSLKNWQPKYVDSEQWLEIILPRLEPIYGIILQGSLEEKKYVTSYKILYSQDGRTFSYIMDSTEKSPQLFQGKIDSKIPVKEFFPEPIEAKVILINPQTWHHGIAMKVDLLGCDEHFSVNVSKTKSMNAIFHEVITVKPMCDDAMGLNNGEMSEAQVTASSTLDKIFPNIKLSSPNLWRPLLDTPTQYIQFDFLQNVNLTGIETKGADNIWTTAYKIFYGQDNKCKNPIIDSQGNEKVFLGNIDSNNKKINYFEKPIRARYLRIYPVRWHLHAGLKIEVHGCFVPYPAIESDKYQSEQPVQSDCNVCPGIYQDSRSKCNCDETSWWTGETCALRQQCPCVVNSIPYPVGVSYETDCQKCMCAMNGVPDCQPKTCDACKEPGHQSIVTEYCDCICKPCPIGMKLCPTSNICIKGSDWCNGIKDCPDDETGCQIFVNQNTSDQNYQVIYQQISSVVVTVHCEVPTCPPGYNTVPMKKSSENAPDSSLLEDKTFEIDIKSKLSPKAPSKMNAVKNEEKFKPFEFECQQYLCVSIQQIMVSDQTESLIKCPEAKCPSKYEIVYESSSLYDQAVCPNFICKPPPPAEVVCNITGHSFNTFDKVEYKYDICNHLLVRDMFKNLWYITLKKSCNKEQSCFQTLDIVSDENTIELYSNMSVRINNNAFTPEQVLDLTDTASSFIITKIGNILKFVSKKYGFWLTWDQNSNIKISITTKLIKHVDGMCGYYDNNIQNDRLKPDGNQAITFKEFGDSWLVDGASECEDERCPKKSLEEAQKICHLLKDKSFSVCDNVIELNKYISRCIESTCNCLNKNVTSEQCRCRELQSFVRECAAADKNVDLSSWRNIHNCREDCRSPLVHKDCFRHKCEITCNNLQEIDACPAVDGFCYSGCFCPDGTVRKDDDCIPPTECRDCSCNRLGYSNFIDFNKREFSFAGNCSYILSQDIVKTKEDKHTYRVFMKNVPCDGRICTKALVILFKEHTVQIEQDLDSRNFTLTIDNDLVNAPYDNSWISLTKKLNNDITILVPSIQLEVTSYRQNFGFTVKIPSTIFGSAIEGLCGSCSIVEENRFKKSNNEFTDNVNEFGLSWLVTGIPQVSLIPAEECISQPIKTCDYSTTNSACSLLTNKDIFGKCHNKIDPSPFIKSCQNTLCAEGDVCGDIETYARKCRESNLCINWRSSEVCPLDCLENLEYKTCGPSCPETCDSISKNETRKCASDLVEGCFCPKDHVLNNGTCIPEKKCFICDEEGHLEGDTWHPDKCTTCSCKNKVVNCEKTKCSALDTVCLENYTRLEVPGTQEECCPKYRCVHNIAPAKNVTCEKPQHPVCGYGQVTKITSGPDGCQKFSCQCLPSEECPPTTLSSSNKEKLQQPGYAEIIKKTGCCPQSFVVCKPETCPKEPKCQKHYEVSKQVIPELCCPIYKCQQPHDKCLYLKNEDNKSELQAAKIGEKWTKGLCDDCVCEKSTETPKAVCTKTQCSKIDDHSDSKDYKLKKVFVKDQCCPKIKRVACKHHDKIYNVGEKWQSNLNDVCETIRCDNDTNVGIQKKIIKENCKTTCEKGYEYKPSSNKNVTCCGKCVPTACVVNGSLKSINEKWHSDDFCTNYECIYDKENLLIKESVTLCEKIDPLEKEKYKIKKEKISGQCCPEYSRVGCRSENKTYLPGESWTNSKDSCITEKCLEKAGKIELIKTVRTCDEDCKVGWEYRDPKEGQCCGECVQAYCSDNGVLHKINATWRSEDNCTIYTCQIKADQLIVNSISKQCPNVSYCQSVRIDESGCCKICDDKKQIAHLEEFSNKTLGECDVVTIDKQQTLGIIAVKKRNNELCKNKEFIKEFSQCYGTCDGNMHFDPTTKRQLKECNCCQPVGKMKSITVELTCDDGTVVPQKILVPIKCSCRGCNNNYLSVKSKAFVKTVKNLFH